MRFLVFRSMPFIRLTTTAVSGIRSLNSASATRANWAAMATTMISASLTACARSPVAVMLSGSLATDGRRTALWCRSRMPSTISGSMAHIVTSLPASAIT